ncbi:MAG: dehydrogenase, partial [Pseudomonadota bacterium]
DPSHFDIAVHTSASADGLDAALDCLGDEGTLIELSWYGSDAVSVRLGGAFHSKRLRLISSQVGRVSPSRRPRRTHAERLATAMALLDDPALDALIDEEVAFADLPARLPAILSPDATNVATIVRYE